MADLLRVVIAPDSFKGSLGALEVASAIAEGWLSVRPADAISLIPQADGGGGTRDAIEAAVPGALRHDVGRVTGPDGRSTPGVWLELPGGIAVVELAQMSGLPLMASLDPLGASTVGLGEVIRAALAAGASRLVIGLGGSASTDGAAGALAALGLRGDAPLGAGGGGLAALRSLDRSALLAPPPGGVTLLTDVAAPLLGPTGAAAGFGQQGLRQEQGFDPVYLGLGVLGATLLGVALGFVSWRMTRYRVTATELQVDSGVLQRRSRRGPLGPPCPSGTASRDGRPAWPMPP